MTEQNNSISIARLEMEVSYLKAGVADLRTSNAEQNAKLDNILSTMAEARGSWRTLLLMGGAAGSIGGLLSWLITHMKA